MIKGIEHIAVCAKDTKRLTDWYVDVFGFKIVYDNGKGTYFVKAEDGSMIEIIKADDGERTTEMTAPGIRHFALSVDGADFGATVARLKDAGVCVLAEAKESASGVKTFFFTDPEGNIFHLISRPAAL